MINPKAFLGNAAFDTIEIYKSLFHDLGFQKAFIPLRVKLSIEGVGYTVNENGIPWSITARTNPNAANAIVTIPVHPLPADG